MSKRVPWLNYFVVIGLLVRFASSAEAQDGGLDTTFTAGFDGDVFSIQVQPDARLLVTGFFSKAGSASRRGVVRLNANGSLDTSFNPGAGPNKGVSVIALQSDGRILIGGTFATFNGISRARVARLNADGSLDSTFDPGAGPNTSVVALSLQPDGKILIGGDFTAIGGVTRNYIARLNADGSLDTSFQPNIALTYGGVLALKTEVDGKCLVCGECTMADGVSRKNL